jgi:protein phosphatase
MIKKNFLVSCGSAKGLRPNNEDAFAFEKNIFGQLFAVICDGIGSQLHSEIVSTNTTTSLAHLFLQKRKIKNPKRFFSKALKNTQKIINKKINEVRKNARIGTTLISCFIDEGKVTVFNIGDSRLFHFDSNEKK